MEMALLLAAEVRQIEKQNARGLSSAQIVEIFRSRGERFSEPTLRKYVQVGLLPKSRRVGSRGRHRGSSGLYPVTCVRQINEIKRALEQGATLDEIRTSQVGLSGEVRQLERVGDQVLQRFSEAASRCLSEAQRDKLTMLLDRRRRSLAREIRELDAFALRVGQWHGRS